VYSIKCVKDFKYNLYSRIRKVGEIMKL